MIEMTKKELDGLYSEMAQFSSIHKYSTFAREYKSKFKVRVNYAAYCAWYDVVYGLPEQVFSISDVGPIQCMICDVQSRELMVYNKVEKKLTTSISARSLPTVFESRSLARKAVWHHVQQSGEPMSHLRWEVVEALETH